MKELFEADSDLSIFFLIRIGHERGDKSIQGIEMNSPFIKDTRQSILVIGTAGILREFEIICPPYHHRQELCRVIARPNERHKSNEQMHNLQTVCSIHWMAE
jgi:hypothetical protein